MSNTSQPNLELEVGMDFGTMKEAKMFCKKVAKQQRFLTVTVDSKDVDNGHGRLVLDCSHHLKPRTTRKEEETKKGSNGNINRTEEIRKRNRDTMQSGCAYQIRFYRRKHTAEWMLITLRNRPIATRVEKYAIYRKPTPAQPTMIVQLIKVNCTNQLSVNALNTHQLDCPADCEVHGLFIAKVIANIRRNIAGVSVNAENAIKQFINTMESRGYTSKHRTNDQNKIRLWLYTSPMIALSQGIANYLTLLLSMQLIKTNRNKMPFVNVVGVSNTGRDFISLANYPIAGAWISSEVEGSYQWIMEQLELAVFTAESGINPGVIVTDQEQALINAIENVYPESDNILCILHISKNFKNNTGPFKGNATKKKKTGRSETNLYFRMKKLKKKGIGNYTNKLSHSGYQTTNRVEGFHETLKPRQITIKR